VVVTAVVVHALSGGPDICGEMALAITNLAKHAASIGTAVVVAFRQDTVRQQWLWGVIEHCCSVTAVVARRQGQLRHRAHPGVYCSLHLC